MPRRATSRLAEPGRAYCYHITQRCQERRFLLRYQKDRRQYLKRLREAALRYPVSVLNYVVTSNHAHILMWAEQARHVSAAMQYLSGTAAQDYNRRVGREGAFWRGRYRPTLIENGHHCTRCFFYIELNMVRAGAAPHPSQWYGGAFAELSGLRQRYRIIERERLLNCLECPSVGRFREWYHRTLEQECTAAYHVRQPWWTEAAAVGSQNWIENLGGRLPHSWREISPVAMPEEGVEEAARTYVLRVSGRVRENLLSIVDR